MANVTYQMRGYCSRSGYERLDEVLRMCAGLYNAALEQRRKAWQTTSYWREQGESPSKFDQYTQFTDVRAADPAGWGALSVGVGRGVLRRLDRSFQNFFRRVKAGETPGYPRFKSSRRWNTIEIDEPGRSMIRDAGERYLIRVKGLPAIKLRKRRELPLDGKLVTLTITHRGRRLIVNATYEVDDEAVAARHAPAVAPERPGGAVGIDMGVSDRLTLSDGRAIARRKARADEIRKKQRRLSACKKGSRERRKRARILANAHYREQVRNRNACHRITTDLVRNYDHIAIEDLRIPNMVKSAAGTPERPGTNVAQKQGLNREIQSQTWGMIRQQLAYKAEWAGRKLSVVDSAHTSQTCSACGAIDKASRSGKAFRCTNCGMEMDADRNAALNIRARALAGVESPPQSDGTGRRRKPPERPANEAA